MIERAKRLLRRVLGEKDKTPEPPPPKPEPDPIMENGIPLPPEISEKGLAMIALESQPVSIVEKRLAEPPLRGSLADRLARR